MPVVETTPSLCKSCYNCVRVCPVKAIKVYQGIAEVVEERCIYCGRCIFACSFGAKRDRDDTKKVKDLLSSDSNTVAIMAREFVASFHPASPSQVEAGLERLGFFAIEELTLGDELIAKELLDLIASKNGHPLIRSSCPALVTWIERYHPKFSSLMATIVPPAIAQGKLVKLTYPPPTAAVYIGPCLAMKAEIEKESNAGAIDAAITFIELKKMFDEAKIDLSALPDVSLDALQPVLVRTYSTSGGFPRQTLTEHSLIDRDIKVFRGVESMEKLIDCLVENESNSCLIDALSCDGCIDGPGINSSLNLYLRKKLVDRCYREKTDNAPRHVSFAQLSLRLPHLDLNKTFHQEPFPQKPLDEHQIEQILAASEKHSWEDELNCGACGYPTCRDQAIAIFQGMAEREMCFPFRKKVYESMMEELKTASTTDWLTNLFNYNGLVEHLEIEMKKAKRYNYPLSLIMLDVDLFKQVNDSYGHVAGDELLKGLAEVISHNVRGADLIARYGGDEFALILPETNKAQAYLVAEKLRRKVETTTFEPEEGKQLNITISLGIAIYLPEKDHFKSFIERADRAMYLAKQAGRNYTELSEEW